MKIAVAGTGYVGLVTGVCLAEIGHDVTCVDIDEKKVALMDSGKSPIYEAGLEELMQKVAAAGKIRYTTDAQAAYKDAETIFIAVGTPESEDGTANLEYVYQTATTIAESVEKDTLVVVKSTVPIGTNEIIEQFLKEHVKAGLHIEVASNPEFLAQGTAVKDTLEASRIVIGVESDWAKEKMYEIFSPFNQPIVCTNRASAEMIKYASNIFLALKVSYINEIANFCELIGADVETVAKGMSYDPRIGDKFLKAGIGFGGSCFPKDTKALFHLAKNEYDFDFKTIDSIISINNDQKVRLFYKAKDDFGNFLGKKVAILGLTFKAGTDDTRESAAYYNIDLLLEEGAEITVYDPEGIPAFEKEYGKKLKYATTIDDAIAGKDITFIMTDWADIKNYPAEQYVKLMNDANVYDGRNCYETRVMKAAGVDYYSIGRGN